MEDILRPTIFRRIDAAKVIMHTIPCLYIETSHPVAEPKSTLDKMIPTEEYDLSWSTLTLSTGK